MKVQNSAIQGYARTAINPTTPVQPLPPEPAQLPSSDDAAHVTISPQARELAFQQGSVNRQKIEALREKINSGELKANPQILAMRILDALG